MFFRENFREKCFSAKKNFPINNYTYKLNQKGFTYNQILNLSNEEKKKLSHDYKDI